METTKFTTFESVIFSFRVFEAGNVLLEKTNTHYGASPEVCTIFFFFKYILNFLIFFSEYTPLFTFKLYICGTGSQGTSTINKIHFVVADDRAQSESYDILHFLQEITISARRVLFPKDEKWSELCLFNSQIQDTLRGYNKVRVHVWIFYLFYL